MPGLGLVDRSPSASPAASVVGAAIHPDQPAMAMVAPSPLAASTSIRPRAWQRSAAADPNVIRASPALNAQLNTTRMTSDGVTPSRLLTFESPAGPSVPLGRSSERPITSTPRAAPRTYSGLIKSGTFNELEGRPDLDGSRPIIEPDASPLGSPQPRALSPSAQPYSVLAMEFSPPSHNQTMTSPLPGAVLGDSPMSRSGVEAFFNSTQRRYDDELPSASPPFAEFPTFG